MKTPYLAYPLDQPWLLTIEELIEAGVQCVKTNAVHCQQKGAPQLPAGWKGSVLMTSGLVEAELAGIATKWLPEGASIKHPESGQFSAIESPRPMVKPQVNVTIMQPPIFPHTSQTKRKTFLTLATAWKNTAPRHCERSEAIQFLRSCSASEELDCFTPFAMTEASILECCIQEDSALLQKFLEQQQPQTGIALWQSLGAIKLPNTILQWHLGIHAWEDFLMRLEEGADILTVEFLPEYTLAGRALTAEGWIDLTLPEFEFSQAPLAQDCQCQSCQDFTRSYLHHLWDNTPLLAQRILAKHNVFYLEFMMQRLRNAEETGKFAPFGKLS